jgi:hypothetical protein
VTEKWSRGKERWFYRCRSGAGLEEGHLLVRAAPSGGGSGDRTLARRSCSETGEAASGPGRSHSIPSQLFKYFSNRTDLIQIERCLPELKHFQIKYGRVGN